MTTFGKGVVVAPPVQTSANALTCTLGSAIAMCENQQFR